MDKPFFHRNIIIKVVSSLAEYRKAYRRVLVSRDEIKQTLEEFIAGFVEDRLAEEIEFLDEETVRGCR